MESHDQAKEELLETDEEFRRLYEEHQSHERRLLEIHDNSAPSLDEELIVKGIKVEKLHLKDRMEAMIRDHL